MVIRTKIMILHECPKCHTHVRITENIDEDDRSDALVEIIDAPNIGEPIQLFSYLITLGSRENDLILDPFIGSGTTAIASRLLNRNFIGFELNKEYYDIANTRINPYIQQKKLDEVV